MNHSIRRSLALTLLLSLVPTLSQAENDKQDFKSYLDLIHKRTHSAHLNRNILAYLQGDLHALSDDPALFELLGTYARRNDRDEMIQLLSQLVAINSEQRPHTPQHTNPAIIALGKLLRQQAERFGLEFYNYDNYLFEIRLPGLSHEAIGFYTHSDVVPSDASQWVLKNGKQLSPYRLTQINDKLYGRGTQDDKGSIVAALFAMKQLKAAHIPLKKTLRLFVTTSEETDGSGLAYFQKHHSYPKLNIGLDGGYPLVVAEKGVGSFNLHFKAMNDSPKLALTITHIQGAKANNIIPPTASVQLKLGKNAPSIDSLRHIAKDYVKENGDDFSIAVREDGDNKITIEAHGRSAHSSTPEDGINPVARILDFIMKVSEFAPITHNHYFLAARVSHDLFGLDYFGTKLGVNYQDKFMGPLTLSLTDTHEVKGTFDLGINIRMPQGETREQLIKKIQDKISLYQQSHGLSFTTDIDIVPPMVRDPKSPAVAVLQDIYRKTTHQTADLVSIAGYTSMHEIPGGLSFGPGMPGKMYMGHHNLEYKSLSDLLLDEQLLINAMGRLGMSEQA